MQVQGSVGAPAASLPVSVGSQNGPSIRLGQLADVIVSELHGRYYESAYRKSLFAGANQAGVATTAAFATTYTGLVLYNPSGSAVNLVLSKVGIASIIAQTSPLAVGIMTGFSTTALSGVTALTPKGRFVGQTAGVGLLASAATLPVAPTLDTVLGVIDTGATTVATQLTGLIDVEGGIVIPPGGYAALYTNVASVAASLIASMAWEEVPV